MTVILKPDFDTTLAQRAQYKVLAARQLRAIAEKTLGVSVDIREAVVGGSAVTATQTNLPPDTDAGGTSNVDIVIEAATTTTVGWHLAAPGAADTMENMIGTTQAVSTSNKLFAFYGVQDFTVGGDLQALQFKSQNNIKAYVETEGMYESDIGDLIGGHFVNSDVNSDDVQTSIVDIVYGTVNNQPITVQGLWHTNVVKNTKLRTFVAEVEGTVITTSKGPT